MGVSVWDEICLKTVDGEFVGTVLPRSESGDQEHVVLKLATGRELLFYCAYGERSAMAVQAAHKAGIERARHIEGGIDAWKRIDGKLEG